MGAHFVLGGVDSGGSVYGLCFNFFFEWDRWVFCDGFSSEWLVVLGL